MKKRLISLMIFVPIALSMFQIEQTIAKPAATFDATIREIKRTMPRGWIVRLPSDIAFAGRDRNVYTNNDGVFFSKDSQELLVILHSTPDCMARYCQLGSLVSSDSNNTESYAHMLLSRPIFSTEDLRRLREIRQKSATEWTEAERKHFFKSEQAILIREPITLKPGITGTFVANRGMGASTPPGMSVVWKQDGFTFRISVRGGVDDSKKVSQTYKTQLINTAISMAKEQPIKAD